MLAHPVGAIPEEQTSHAYRGHQVRFFAVRDNVRGERLEAVEHGPVVNAAYLVPLAFVYLPNGLIAQMRSHARVATKHMDVASLGLKSCG